MLSRLNQRKLKSIGFFVLAWLAVASFYLFIRYFGMPTPIAWDILIPCTIQFGLLAGLSQGIYEVFVLGDDRFHRTLIESTIIRTIFSSSSILSNIIIVHFLATLQNQDEMFTPSSMDSLVQVLSSQEIMIFFIFMFISSFLITFARSVSKKFGSRVLINSVLGKYQDPTEEERIFMFIDLKSATTLAEELGHFSYSGFLRDYFQLLSNCCVENRGEVYQFAGDGVILTWTMASCRRRARPVLCYFDAVQCFRKTRRRFEKKYGTYPHFKAALHVGRVVSTEVGNYGSEMAYHGDALNTTARLQSLCNLLKRDALMSETFVRKMPHLEGYTAEPQGSFQLKGKNRDLEVFSLEE